MLYARISAVDLNKGKVRFDPSGPISVADGKATATARFSQRGTYVLRATANDGALATKTDVTIIVAGS